MPLSAFVMPSTSFGGVSISMSISRSDIVSRRCIFTSTLSGSIDRCFEIAASTSLWRTAMRSELQLLLRSCARRICRRSRARPIGAGRIDAKGSCGPPSEQLAEEALALRRDADGELLSAQALRELLIGAAGRAVGGV